MMNFANPDLSSALYHVQSGYGQHMHDGGYMFGNHWGVGSLIHVVLWLLVLVAIVAVTLFFARSLSRGGSGKNEGSKSSAIDHLDERYARGEIDREEYLRSKKDIIGH
jgi:putative membrane protein